jgi:hypothetical protein
MSTYRADFDSSSNLGHCYKIYELIDNAYIYVGQVFATRKNEEAAVEQFLDSDTNE